MVVYTTNDGEFATVAERIATDRHESLVTDLATATDSTEEIIYVEDPADISEQTLLTLQQRLLERTPTTGSFSIITGYTPEFAEELYFSKVDHNDEDLLLFANQSPTGVDDIDVTSLLEKDDVTAATLEKFSSEPLRSFAINANGRTIHISIADGFICGAPDSQSVQDYPGRQPFCVQDGKVDCPLSDNLVSAESINAAHIFLLSCSSTVDNATSRLPILPSLGLLNGTDSLIGAYRVAPSWPYELLFHHSLLLSGYNLIDRCYLLNKNSHINGIMGYPYVAYGRPDARIDDPHHPQFDVEFHAGEDLRVHLSEIDGYALDFLIPEELVPTYDERLYIRNDTDTDSRVYYLTLEEDDGVRVLLFTGGHIQLSDLDLTVSASRTQQIKRDISINSMRNTVQTEEMGFFGADTMERLPQIRKEIRNLPKQTESELFDSNRHKEIDQVMNVVHGQINAVRENLLSSLREHSDYLMYEYASSASDDEVYASEYTCPTCTVRPMFIKQISGWSHENKRLFGTCPRCGFVLDVPTRGRDPAPPFPLVTTDLGTDVSDPKLTIEFENQQDVPVHATFQPLVLHMDNASTSFFDPDRRDTILSPGESHTAEFDVNAAEFPDNMYYIMGVVVANMSVHAGYTATVVGDRGAYYPGHLR